MSVQYFEPIIDEIEKKNGNYFVGYINPRGMLIDYSTLIGKQTHYSAKNPASMMFLRFISYVIKNFNPIELKFCWDKTGYIYENNKTDGIENVVKRGFDYYELYNNSSYDDFLEEVNDCYESRQKYIKEYVLEHSFESMPVYEQLQNDLMFFFHNAYQDKDFFSTVGITPQVERYEDYMERHEKEICEKRKISTWYRNRSDRDFYNEYQIAQLMSYFKDIMVMYMKYDSIERRLKLKANGQDVFKVITSSCPNPNERFFNWLINDWEIQRIPRMYLEKNEKRFVQESELINYYQTDKEKILEEEIASIKKLVPKEYRNKYFRM